MAPEQNGDKADRRVRVSKTAELIANDLRGRIARGVLKKGDVLPNELELMRQFGVSRPTLREAFRILESESLIVVRRGSRGGVIVSAPEITAVARNFGLLLQMAGTTVADIYEARKFYEPAVVRLLTTRHTDHDIEDLTACVEALAVQVNDSGAHADLNAWSIAALRFHDLLVERSGNTTVALFSSVLSEVTSRHMSQVVTASSDRTKIQGQFKKMVRAFRKLTTLIESGNADEAERFWHQHLDIAGKALLRGQAAAAALIDLYVQTPMLRQLNTT